MSAHPFQIKEKDNTQLQDMQLLQKQLEVMTKNYELAQKQEEDRERANKAAGVLLLIFGVSQILGALYVAYHNGWF